MRKQSSRQAQVAIREIGEWKPGKYKPFTPVRVVVVKELSTGKNLNLSLNKKSESRVNMWTPALTLGNVLTVQICKKENGTEYVDFMGPFSLDRNLDNDKAGAAKKEKETPALDEASLIALGNQLVTTHNAITAAFKAFKAIEEDYPEFFKNY